MMTVEIVKRTKDDAAKDLTKSPIVAARIFI